MGELETKVQELEKKVNDLSVLVNMKNNSLDRNTNVLERRIIEDVVQDEILDLFWGNFFYYNTWFESPDGFNVTNDATISGGGLAVTSPGSGVASSSIYALNTSFAGGFSLLKESRMRCTAQYTRIVTQDIRIGVGDVVAGDAYGFRVSNATLQGFAQTAPGTRTTFNILTITANTDYDLEARYYPGNKVSFFVDGVERGNVSATLPVTVGTKLWEAESTESAAETKQIFIGSFEYIQRLN